LRLPHFYAAMAVVAQSDLVVTLPRSMALRFQGEFGLATLAPPLSRPPFTITAIWPEVLDADPGSMWLRGIVKDEASRIENVIPL
jgi:DNA-binding transcriptional LysR family regulator